MIEKKLNDKIEDTVAAAELHNATFAEPESPEPVMQTSLDSALAEPVTTALSTEDPSVAEPEPIQVAGLGGVAKALQKATAAAEKRVLPPIGDEPIQKVGGSLLVREASDDEVQALATVTGEGYKKGINFPRIVDNLEGYDLEDHLARLMEANKELFKRAKRGILNIDALKIMAEENGLDSMVTEWLKRTPGSGDTAEKLLGGMMAAIQLSSETRSAFTAAKAMPVGPERDAALARAKQLMTIEANLYANLSGAGSEAGRTLYMLSAAPKVLEGENIAQRADELINLFGADNAQDIEYLGDLYLALPDNRSRSQFVQQGLGAKSMDVAIEVWINSILTAPTTHMVNIAGNSVFMANRTLETAVAGMIGRLRSGVGIGGKDRVRVREALAQLEGIRLSFKDALLVSGKTLFTEDPSDIVTKIDVRQRRSIGTSGDPRVVLEQIKKGEAGAAAVNVLGISARMGGRFLLAEDEFFKGMGYRSALHQMAFMRGADMYDAMIDAGKTVDEAKAAAAEEHARILSNPPKGLVEDARSAAREMTFQGDLPGFWGDLQVPLSHPIAKLFVPFYKTPTNVMKETMKRSPLMLAYPGFYKKLAAGGREADMALAQVSTGSMIMGAFAYTAMGLDTENNDVIIMGSGPSDRRAQDAMQRKGIQPFSVNFKQEDGTYQSITYSRFDPISGMLAMAADFAYYAQYEDDVAILDQLSTAAVLGISQYAMDMPFLQGVQELSRVFTHPDPKVRVEQFMEMMGQKGTEAVLSLAPTVSSFSAGIERIGDPAMSSPMLPEAGLLGEDPTQLPAFMRGFYTALQKAKGRNPFFSDTVEPKLNLWGEVMMAGEGEGWEFISPVRIKDTKFAPVDDELMALGGGVAMNPKKVDGVLLNAKQYNEWLTIQNTYDGANNLFPGDPGYDASQTLIPQLMNFIDSADYQALPTKADKLSFINNIVGQYRSAALKILRMRDPYLDAKINAVQ